MISAKQVKNILEYSLQSTGFIEPVLNLAVTPNNYTELYLTLNPGTNSVIGSIVANDATGISWVLKKNGVTVSSGTGLSISFAEAKPAVNTVYTLEATYTGGATTKSVSTNVIVEKTAYYGQLTLPTDDIVVATDLLPFINPAGLVLDYCGQQFIGNLFTMVLTNTGRICLVSPYSYGTVVDIVDENDISAINEFNLVNDIPNSRYIYTMINTISAGTYKYKIQY